MANKMEQDNSVCWQTSWLFRSALLYYCEAYKPFVALQSIHMKGG